MCRYYQPNNQRLLAPNDDLASNAQAQTNESRALERDEYGLTAADRLNGYVPPSPSLKHDPTLTAFAQLGAFRLDCERAYKSIINHDKEFLLAEATRSLMLTDPEQWDKSITNDRPYLGPRALDINFGVCSNAIKIFTALDDSHDISTSDALANQTCYVFNDLAMIPAYKDREYVRGFPFMKFYAEVPIHSPAGYVIGTYCVVDNRPRNGLDPKGLVALNEVSAAIMQYLRFVQMQQSLMRAGQMVKGLGLFLDGKSSVQEWWAHNFEGHLAGLDTLNKSPSQSRVGGGTVQTISQADSQHGSPQVSRQPSPGLTDGEQEPKAEPPQSLMRDLPNPMDNGQPSRLSMPSSISDVAEKDSMASAGIKQLFARAGNLIREALAVDGVLFFWGN